MSSKLAYDATPFTVAIAPISGTLTPMVLSPAFLPLRKSRTRTPSWRLVMGGNQLWNSNNVTVYVLAGGSISLVGSSLAGIAQIPAGHQGAYERWYMQCDLWVVCQPVPNDASLATLPTYYLNAAGFFQTSDGACWPIQPQSAVYDPTVDTYLHPAIQGADSPAETYTFDLLRLEEFH